MNQTAPRIAPLSPPYTTTGAEMLQKLMPPGMEPLGLFRTIANNEVVLRSLVDNGKLVYKNSTLNPVHREILIHRTCAICGAEYEWGVHAALFGKRIGLSDEKVKATYLGDAKSDTWNAEEASLMQLADELHESATISDSLWDILTRTWTESQIMELITIVGFYHTIAFLARGLHIKKEDFAPSFPSRLQPQ